MNKNRDNRDWAKSKLRKCSISRDCLQNRSEEGNLASFRATTGLRVERPGGRGAYALVRQGQARLRPSRAGKCQRCVSAVMTQLGRELPPASLPLDDKPTRLTKYHVDTHRPQVPREGGRGEGVIAAPLFSRQGRCPLSPFRPAFKYSFSEYGAAPELKRRGKREIPENTLRPTASSGTIPTCENSVTRPGIEPGLRPPLELSPSLGLLFLTCVHVGQPNALDSGFIHIDPTPGEINVRTFLFPLRRPRIGCFFEWGTAITTTAHFSPVESAAENALYLQQDTPALLHCITSLLHTHLDSLPWTMKKISAARSFPNRSRFFFTRNAPQCKVSASEDIWAALNTEVSRADEVWNSAGMKGRGKREISDKTRRPTASSGTISTCENPVTRPGIEPGSPWWKASGLTAPPTSTLASL
ncbi:hypothetical protein PR048_025934 [Dryococelus australis]|uniref:Uncharacterized protein n=1 Tax=Dryococelus australis TaxID=614101 RepID=A0ABQ9GJX7_9NEOP|nr:hypothetical protein PR048_025934 [Dryococelus australis]